MTETETTHNRNATTPAGITERQRDLLRFIQTYTSETGGVPPSYSEMAEHLGVVKSNIHRMVNGLEERGRITRRSGLTRSIMVLEP
jgi:DNA-binding MarR family transcriptional regulator